MSSGTLPREPVLPPPGLVLARNKESLPELATAAAWPTRPEGVPARPGRGRLPAAGGSAPRPAMSHSHGTEIIALRFRQTRLPQTETLAPLDQGDTPRGTTERAREDGHAPRGAGGPRAPPPGGRRWPPWVSTAWLMEPLPRPGPARPTTARPCGEAPVPFTDDTGQDPSQDGRHCDHERALALESGLELGSPESWPGPRETRGCP